MARVGIITKMVNMNFRISKCILSLLFIVSWQNVQAELYRCGNTYQDTPCKISNGNSNVSNPIKIKTTANSGTAQAGKTVDADCTQRGNIAKKIMWMRETGKTAEEQIANPQDGASERLIRDVYNHRGSSIQVKNAIEQECMQQKEKDALAEKYMKEAERLRAGGTPSAIIPNRTAKIPVEKSSIKESSEDLPRDEIDKTSNCGQIKRELDNLYDKRRRGGSAEYMERLKHQELDLTSQSNALGCP